MHGLYGRLTIIGSGRDGHFPRSPVRVGPVAEGTEIVLPFRVVRHDLGGAGTLFPVDGIFISGGIGLRKRPRIQRRLIGVGGRALVHARVVVEDEIFAVNFRRRAPEQKFPAVRILRLRLFAGRFLRRDILRLAALPARIDVRPERRERIPPPLPDGRLHGLLHRLLPGRIIPRGRSLRRFVGQRHPRALPHLRADRSPFRSRIRNLRRLRRHRLLHLRHRLPGRGRSILRRSPVCGSAFGNGFLPFSGRRTPARTNGFARPEPDGEIGGEQKQDGQDDDGADPGGQPRQRIDDKSAQPARGRAGIDAVRPFGGRGKTPGEIPGQIPRIGDGGVHDEHREHDGAGERRGDLPVAHEAPADKRRHGQINTAEKNGIGEIAEHSQKERVDGNADIPENQRAGAEDEKSERGKESAHRAHALPGDDTRFLILSPLVFFLFPIFFQGNHLPVSAYPLYTCPLYHFFLILSIIFRQKNGTGKSFFRFLLPVPFPRRPPARRALIVLFSDEVLRRVIDVPRTQKQHVVPLPQGIFQPRAQFP